MTQEQYEVLKQYKRNLIMAHKSRQISALTSGVKTLTSALTFLSKNIEHVAMVLGVVLFRKLTIMRTIFLEKLKAPIGSVINSLQMLVSGEIINGLKALGVAGWKAVAPWAKFLIIFEVFNLY